MTTKSKDFEKVDMIELGDQIIEKEDIKQKLHCTKNEYIL